MTKAKKKTALAKKSRVFPPVPNINPHVVRYDDLEAGECFILGGNLMIKYDVENQEGLILEGAGWREGLCDEIVIPVDIKVTWKRK